MSKSSFSPEFKAQVAQEYLDGNHGYKELASNYQIDPSTLREWVKQYELRGIGAFNALEGNRSYSSEFKLRRVKDVLSGEGSIREIAVKYNITRSVLRNWILRYNANKELKDYDPKREVYMAEARRKTTQAERTEIVKYCIEHGRDYKGTAALYDVSYSQVYGWVKKYDADGEDGLKDGRGHRKSDDEVDELERLRRENTRLKRKLQEKDMAVELLKKVREFEGR